MKNEVEYEDIDSFTKGVIESCDGEGNKVVEARDVMTLRMGVITFNKNDVKNTAKWHKIRLSTAKRDEDFMSWLDDFEKLETGTELHELFFD